MTGVQTCALPIFGGEAAALGDVLRQRGVLLRDQREFAAAEVALRQALEIARSSGLVPAEAATLVELGELANRTGGGGHLLLTRAVPLLRQTGRTLALATALLYLAEACRLAGELPEAEAALAEADALHRQIGAPQGQALALWQRARLLQDAGAPADARVLARQAATALTNLGERTDLARLLEEFPEEDQGVRGLRAR